MSALSSNSLYLNFCKSFPKYGIKEDVACIQGFVLGSLARGFSSSSRELLTHTINIINDGEPFSGSAIASYTTLVIEMERELKKKQVALYIPEQDDNIKKLPAAEFQKLRLEAVAQFAYGLNLGSGFTPSGVIKDSDLSRDERDNLILLEQISSLDTSASLDEEDFAVVVTSLKDILYSLKKK